MSELKENSLSEYGFSKEMAPFTKSTRTRPGPPSPERNDSRPLFRESASTRKVKRCAGSSGARGGDSVSRMRRRAVLRLSIADLSDDMKTADAPPPPSPCRLVSRDIVLLLLLLLLRANRRDE